MEFLESLKIYLILKTSSSEWSSVDIILDNDQLCTVHNLCTGWSLSESDDTRRCINTIQPPDDEHIMLETCREL